MLSVESVQKMEKIVAKWEYEKSNIFVTDVAQHYQRKWLFVITLFLCFFVLPAMLVVNELPRSLCWLPANRMRRMCRRGSRAPLQVFEFSS